MKKHGSDKGPWVNWTGFTELWTAAKHALAGIRLLSFKREIMGL